MPVTQFITTDTDLMQLVHEHFPQLNQETTSPEDPPAAISQCTMAGGPSVLSELSRSGPFLLTGLHTCGNLGASMVRLFASSADVGMLCNVACCYHLLEEEFIRNPLLKQGEKH